MFEIQGDAGGWRFVAPLAVKGVMTSCAERLTVGEPFEAIHVVAIEGVVAGRKVRVQAEQPLTVNTKTLKSLFIHVTQPLTVNIGTQPFDIVPHAPLIWFEEWPTDCPIEDADSELGITATATEENTQLTILLVN